MKQETIRYYSKKLSLTSNHSTLAIGTAQFGMPYGIANKTGQVGVREGQKILETAYINGIDTLDTAIGYGDSEMQLGEMGVKGWKIITKVLPLPDECIDANKWIHEAVHGSLKRLQVDSLYGVLFHNPDQLLSAKGLLLYDELYQLKKAGLIKKIGISVYTPEQLDRLFAELDFDIVQAPFNILNRSIERSGWLAKLSTKKVEVHVRSVFLQGLLLMKVNERPVKFNKWNAVWQAYDRWLLEERLTPLQACLNFVLNNPFIDKAVVGIDSLKNLEEILEVAGTAVPEFPANLFCDDPALINPALW